MPVFYLHYIEGEKEAVVNYESDGGSVRDAVEFFISQRHAGTATPNDFIVNDENGAELEMEKALSCRDICILSKSTIKDFKENAALDLLGAVSQHIAKQSYSAARHILEEFVKVNGNVPAVLSMLGTIYIGSRKWSLAIETFQKLVTAEPGQVAGALKLADAYFQDGNFEESERTIKGLLANVRESLSEGDANDIKALLARAVYQRGDRESAIALLQNVIQSDDRHLMAMIWYSKAARDKKRFVEAIKIGLAGIVAHPNSEEIRAEFGKTMQEAENALQLLFSELSINKHSAPAVAFLALVLKDHGVMNQSIELYKKSCQLVPSNASFALNYIHTLELIGSHQRPFDAAREFLQYNKTFSVGNVSNAAILKEIDGIIKLTNPEDHLKSYFAIERRAVLHWNEGNVTLDPPFAFRTVAKTGEYTAEELDVLALWYTVCKLLFVSGYITPLPRLAALIDPLRSGKNLHLTNIRNENAYFTDVSQLASLLSKVEGPSEYDRKLYVCGDSHSLSPSWRTISVHGIRYLMYNKLVTGVKCWHLRPDSVFYPKRNFENVIKSIPDGSEVLMIIGEIDCREGVLRAVEKGYYSSIEEGFTVTVQIYLKVLKDLHKKRRFTLYVHPALPVLDPTRKIVAVFNEILRSTLQKLNSKGIHFLDIASQVLTPDGTALKEEYAFDGTHIHPSYLSLVADAIALAKKPPTPATRSSPKALQT